jgi:hypothetical protein
VDVKEAVTAAKSHLADLFEGEKVMNLGLEEVEFDEEHREWRVTVGFSRPWDREPNPALGSLADVLTPMRQLARDYKIVRLRDSDGRVLAVKNHG